MTLVMEEDIYTNLSRPKKVPAFDITKGLSQHPAPSNFVALATDKQTYRALFNVHIIHVTTKQKWNMSFS